MDDDRTASALFRLLHDRYARTILIEANGERKSAKELADACDASLSTIYRRVDTLQEHGMLAESTNVDADGHHYTLYETTIETINIEITTDEIQTTISRKTDPADQFSANWEELREG